MSTGKGRETDFRPSHLSYTSSSHRLQDHITPYNIPPCCTPNTATPCACMPVGLATSRPGDTPASLSRRHKIANMSEAFNEKDLAVTDFSGLLDFDTTGAVNAGNPIASLGDRYCPYHPGADE